MVEGYTEDVDVVVDGDEDDGDGGCQTGNECDDPGEPNPAPPPQVSSTDRSEYQIVRDKPGGQIQSIEYTNGNSIEVGYDDEGNLNSVVDTATGSRMEKTDKGWVAIAPDGTQTDIEGAVTIDQSNGAIVAQMNDGRTITTYPDGRTTAYDASGNLIAVDNPGFKNYFNNGSSYMADPVHATATYDDNGNLTSASDKYGNTYRRQADGSWTVTNKYDVSDPTDTSKAKKVDGNVTMDPYRGIVITPSASEPENPPSRNSSHLQ